MKNLILGTITATAVTLLIFGLLILAGLDFQMKGVLVYSLMSIGGYTLVILFLFNLLFIAFINVLNSFWQNSKRRAPFTLISILFGISVSLVLLSIDSIPRYFFGIPIEKGLYMLLHTVYWMLMFWIFSVFQYLQIRKKENA